MNPEEKETMSELVSETSNRSGLCRCGGSIATQSDRGGMPVLSRRSWFYGTWTFFLLPAAVLMNVLVTPVGIAFADEYNLATLAVLFCGDAIMLLDIILHFNTSYFDNTSMELITDRRELARRYIRSLGKFPLHCVASFPVDIICLLAGSLPRVFFAVRVLRCLRIVNIYSAVTE